MDKPARYSDEVPYEKRRYWYFTTHGVGPGTIPKDLKVLETRDGQNQKGTWGEFFCLDGVLNTDELRTYDCIELAPPENDGSVSTEQFIEKFFRDHNFYGMLDEIYEDDDGVHIHIEMGDWSHEHQKCKILMGMLGYRQVYVDSEPSEDDCYSAWHLYKKKE